MSAKIEKDWITNAGLRAVILALPAGHRCGYVAVSPEHKYFGSSYDDVPVDVHGGLTFSADNLHVINEPNLWWLGYDCAHYMDAPDPELMSDDFRAYNDRFSRTGTIRTKEFCELQCENLARQFQE